MSAPPIERFISPYEDAAPAGAEGWQALYPYYLTFRDERREIEEGKFWFADLAHWPRVFKPFDTIMVEFACKCLGQYNTRHYLIPPANGIDYRVHNGYTYMSPVAVPEHEIPARVPQFLARAGHYFQNWPTLLENWETKMRRVIADLEAISFEPLPDVVPEDWVTSGKGLDNTFGLMTGFNRTIELCYEAWQYHFEFLNLGYAAYLDFFGFCKQAFPGISDLGIAKMVQGIEVDLFRPDDELRKLAKLAVEVGQDSDEWRAAYDAAKDPWFNFTSGNGFYSDDKVWLDNPEIPLGYIRGYIEKLQAGESIDRPTAEVAAERDRITSEYRALLADDEIRAAFDSKLGLSRLVFPYVENHNFFVEHWALSVFWRRMRELGAVLSQAGFWPNADDIFYIRRDELHQVIYDYGSAWAVGTEAIGPGYWPDEIERRRSIIAALESKPPAPALNQPPEVITEPFTIMLYGITTERVSQWLSGPADPSELTGMAASPGTAEGIARVITSVDQLDELHDGEILVARITAPSWGPVFGRIGATVTDIGGMMSHAAIVCREYGLPAVTGTGSATATIRSGQRVRVDGFNGTVTLLD